MCAGARAAGRRASHVSCLAEQAKILYAEAEENNLGLKVINERAARWYSCSLCEQDYHGVVRCALGWACWKTYVDRPETQDSTLLNAMTLLGNGLCLANHDKDALSVREAELSMIRRLGAPEEHVLAVQGNLAITYRALGRLDEELRLRQDVYSATLKLLGKEHRDTLLEANNYANSLIELDRLIRFKEAKALLRKMTPVARRVLGESDATTLRMRRNYARALYRDSSATLDDLREAVTTLEEIEPAARRVLGGAHPLVLSIGKSLRASRVTLRGREAGKSVIFVKC